MSAGSLKTDVCAIFNEGIDQNPIWFDMAITAALEFATQSVVFVFGWQRLTFNQQFDDGFDLGQIFAAFLGAFDIFLELGSATEASHKPRSA